MIAASRKSSATRPARRLISRSTSVRPCVSLACEKNQSPIRAPRGRVRSQAPRGSVVATIHGSSPAELSSLSKASALLLLRSARNSASWLPSVTIRVAACGTEPAIGGDNGTDPGTGLRYDGNAAEDAELFAVNCANCHGADGKGTKDGPQILNPREPHEPRDRAPTVDNPARRRHRRDRQGAPSWNAALTTSWSRDTALTKRCCERRTFRRRPRLPRRCDVSFGTRLTLS
jgi:hypothetical protein